MTFNLYFAGVGKNHMDFIFELGAHTLLSQLNDRKPIESWIEKRSGDCKLFVDSGAYSAHTKDRDVDVDDYVQYVNKISESIEIFAQLDKIPGRFNCLRTHEDIETAPAISWDNYLYMREHVKEPDKLVPIFHQDESFTWLENMLEWTDANGHHIPYIGLSCAKDKDSGVWQGWFSKCFEIIESSSNPNVKTHAFGVTAFHILEKFPFTSSDSTAWLRDGIYGRLFCPWGRISIGIKGNKMVSPTIEQKMIAYVESKGYDYELLKTKDTERCKFNLQYIHEWAQNYEYKGPASFKKWRLF